ncbi:hypothetical protein L873DRAFT_1771169 [Choiromyces venosus 120613-1]|uniref:Zn(2)-C6 fungal-type domain-containing protein n=1 Tax=Choiromyces venosus 120613-1 TaxID=1336337 RepID=A0A3N4JH66_9PEZI|nr:hypothetical protein L873DRAFT_1771169 [Choiromyces venosus 120613-1]
MAGSPRSPPSAPAISVSSSSSAIPAKRPLSDGNSNANNHGNGNAVNNHNSSSPPANSTFSTPAAHASLSTPPTKKVLERNQACLSCRSRKRKCDGGKPTCGACERLERRCQYSQNSPATVTKIHSSSSASHQTQKASQPLHQQWTAPNEDSTALKIGTPPPRADRSEHVSTNPVAASTVASGGVAVSNHSAFTPINVDSTSQSPTANGNSSLRHEIIQSYDLNKNAKRPYDNITSNYEANLFACQFLQASPLVGLDAIDTVPWADSPAGVFDDRHKKNKSLSPQAIETPESTNSATTLVNNDVGGALEELPSHDSIVELFELFFDQIHPIIPCLYRKQILAGIQLGGSLSKPCPLVFAVLALASLVHPAQAMQDRSARWHAAAKRGFDAAVTRGNYSLNNVQASIYICMYCFVTAELSELWIFLGKGYRMSNPLGLHQIDSPRRGRFPGFLPHPKSEQDLEERRRAAWGLYVLDSFFSCSCGWPLAINDRDFCVNFPVDEDVFQSGEIEKMSHIVVEPFAHNLADLIGPTSASSPPRGPFHYLCKLAVLIGRIVSYNNSPIAPTDNTEFESLETTLARFRLSLPRKYRNIVGLSPSEVTHVTQLQILLHVCTILLHHPTPAFTRCVSAVNNILFILKAHINSPPPCPPTRSPVVIDVLQNPFITPSLFLSARILAVRWLETGRDKGVRAEIELILGVFDRIKEVWPDVAGKYRCLVLADLARDGNGLGCIKSGVGGYMGKECAAAYVGAER